MQFVLSLIARPLRWLIEGQRWVWLLPIPFFEFVRHEQGRLHVLSAAIVTVWLVIAVSRRPALGLAVLIVLLPFDTYVLAGLLHLGVPTAVIRPLRFWHYGIAAGLAVAALKRFQDQRRRLDAIDKLALGYLALGTAYLLLPKVFVGTAVGAHLNFYSRELGWRSDVFYVLLFLIVRHLRLGRAQVERIVTGFLIAGTAVAALAVFEFLDKGTWNHISVKVFEVTRYEQAVLHYVPSASFNPNTVLVYGTFGGHRFVRVGSVLDYESLSFYMALSLGMAAEMIARARARTWLLVAVPVMAVALLVTQTRSGVIAGVVAVLIALRAQIGRSILHRIRLSLVVGLVVVVALPFVLFSGVGDRLVGNSDNSTHRGSFNGGVHAMSTHPFGRGLATSAGAGQQAVVSGANSTSQGYSTTEPAVLITESQWLQIGTELGLLGLSLFVVLCVLVIHRLRPRSPGGARAPSAVTAMGVRNGFVGLLVGGTFLQPFINLPMSFTTFSLLGLGVALIDQTESTDAVQASTSAAALSTGRPVATIFAHAFGAHNHHLS